MLQEINETSNHYKIYNKSCMDLEGIEDNSIDALITDPPYGISVFNETWDKPNEEDVPSPKIWGDCLRVLKPGAFGLVFSFPRVMHRVMWHLENQGFIIKDVFSWVYFNGMPKTRNIGLDLDKAQNVKSEVVGTYKYVQGYKKGGADTYKVQQEKPILQPASELGKKYNGAGTNVKPFYEPIILVQKRPEGSIAENIIKHGVGVLNLEATRIPYLDGETKVGHNPHPLGRVAGNILTADELEKEYFKYFGVQLADVELTEKFIFKSKVRQNAESFNNHPTKKPVRLMEHLVKLLSWEGQTVLDPFMGSGSTGVACMTQNRNFVGYELEEQYYDIAQKRIKEAEKKRLERLDL